MGDPFASYSFDLPKPLLQLIFLLNRISLALSLLLIFLHLRPPPPPPPPLPAPQSRSIPSPESQPPSIKTLLPLARFAALAGDSASPACAVCLGEFAASDEVRVLGNCRHVFHRECIDRWIDVDGSTCPLCRSPLLSSPEVEAEEAEAEAEAEEKGLIAKIFAVVGRIPFSINLFIANFVVDNYL